MHDSDPSAMKPGDRRYDTPPATLAGTTGLFR